MSSYGPLSDAGNFVDRHARLFGVPPVVEPDREDLPRRRHGAAEVGLDERTRRPIDGPSEVDELSPAVEQGHGVGVEPTV